MLFKNFKNIHWLIAYFFVFNFLKYHFNCTEGN